MSDLKKSTQTGTGFQTGQTTEEAGGESENNSGAEFGTSERGTRGTNRDADDSGESMNQGHGHTREERNANKD
jgi:hypothetical protein